MKFEEKLISLRKSKGLSQEELAEYLGVSRQAISRWEAGSSTPDMTNLLGICEYFRVSSDYLIHDDYDSDEDIPIAKKKDSDIRAAKSRQKELRLAAAVCLLFAGLCFIIGICSAPPTLSFLSCIYLVCFLIDFSLAGFHLYKYFKGE